MLTSPGNFEDLIFGQNLSKLLLFPALFEIFPYSMLQEPEIRQPIAISLGAIAGALSRYYLTMWFTEKFGNSFPYGTFFINISGCLIMGFFATVALEKIVIISPELRLMVATGFIGAYTTFSTYSLDTINLIYSGRWLSAGIYWAGSAILGIISVQLGIVVARIL